MSSLKMESLAHKVEEQITHGKELHADEQAPAFLYSDVMDLEKLWSDLKDLLHLQYSKTQVKSLYLSCQTSHFFIFVYAGTGLMLGNSPITLF